MIAAVVGAGGKTTVCATLANYLEQRCQKVLFTTTTKIRLPENGPVYIGNPAAILRPKSGFLTAGSAEIEYDKINGYTPLEIEQIRKQNIFDSILVEGDGAKGKPVKAPGEWEPVYPLHTDVVIGVIGLDCLGRPIADQTVHRSSLFMEITQTAPGDRITTEHLSILIHHPNGLFRFAPAVPRAVFFNKADMLPDGYRPDMDKLTQACSFPVFITERGGSWPDDFMSWYSLAQGRY